MSSTLKLFADPDTRVFSITVLVSVVAHAFLILGVGVKMPDPSKLFNRAQLDVVLVNAHSKTKPTHAEVLAQANLDGGGNTDELNRRVSTPLPLDDVENASDQLVPVSNRVQELEIQQQKLLSELKNTPKLAANEAQPKASNSPAGVNADNQSRKASDIARLEGEVDRNHVAYQSRPRKAFVGGRAKEEATARYIEDWRTRIERIGNLNFPKGANGKRLYGTMQVTVGIRADGTLVSVELDRPSGNKALDEAAKRIVAQSAPFATLPSSIRDVTGKPADILYITRSWTFSSNDNSLSQATRD